jgi:hypothetical protein
MQKGFTTKPYVAKSWRTSIEVFCKRLADVMLGVFLVWTLVLGLVLSRM